MLLQNVMDNSTQSSRHISSRVLHEDKRHLKMTIKTWCLQTSKQCQPATFCLAQFVTKVSCSQVAGRKGFFSPCLQLSIFQVSELARQSQLLHTHTNSQTSSFLNYTWIRQNCYHKSIVKRDKENGKFAGKVESR